MLTEIIREHAKSNENTMIPSECVFTWAKGTEVQRAHTAVINSLCDVKNFDAILQKDEYKHRETKPGIPVKMPTGRGKYCGQVHKLR